ncbi:MAG: DNA-binding response regulator [Saccharofermentanales bacterium]
MGETVGAVTLLTRKPFPLLILLWSLYPSKSGQAIPSALCHFKLAKTTGLELAQKIYDEQIKTIVVFLSGYADFKYAKRALCYGVKDYILKPAKYNDLLEVFTRIKRELDFQANETVLSLEKQNTDNKLETDSASYNDKVIDTVKRYIEAHYATANLESASMLVRISPNYLSQFFKRITGENFSEYLLKVRMLKSKELLGDIKLNIKEISRMVGYTNPKNFTRAFKKYFGLAPAVYRKKGNENSQDKC